MCNWWKINYANLIFWPYILLRNVWGTVPCIYNRRLSLLSAGFQNNRKKKITKRKRVDLYELSVSILCMYLYMYKTEITRPAIFACMHGWPNRKIDFGLGNSPEIESQLYLQKRPIVLSLFIYIYELQRESFFLESPNGQKPNWKRNSNLDWKRNSEEAEGGKYKHILFRLWFLYEHGLYIYIYESR
jgi:hypothetical protein